MREQYYLLWYGIEVANNSSIELLRVSILSLDGIQYTTSKDGVPAAATQQKVNISACVGFRSSTISHKSIAVPCSQYTTLFDSNDNSDHNTLVVYSDELVIPCTDRRRRNTNVELHWNNKQKFNRHAPIPTDSVMQQQNDMMHAHSIDEQIVPHLELVIPQNGHQSSSSVDDMIELHICVMCTSDENQICTDND